jgi:hypothetical protein
MHGKYGSSSSLSASPHVAHTTPGVAVMAAYSRSRSGSSNNLLSATPGTSGTY